MAFVEQEDILSAFEGLTTHLLKEIKGVDVESFPRMTYDEAMKRYGNDKPDIRFGMEFGELNAVAQHKEFNVFNSAELVVGIAVPGGNSYTRKEIDKLTDWVKRPQVGALGMVYSRCNDDGTFKSSVDKFYDQEDLANWAEATGAKKGDLVCVLSGDANKVRAQLSALRMELAERLGLRNPEVFAPLWTQDAVRANAYDLVLNGNEIGGGSIRIHDKETQATMFKHLGFTPEEAKEQFGFLMDAFQYGAPPHGVGFGGSVGLLGPAVASGSAISSNLGRILHLNSKTRSLLIACASAGAVASIFQSPIAAIIFAVEIFSIDFAMLSVMPLLLASVSGVLTSYFFLGNEVLFDFSLTDNFEVEDTLFYVLLGVGTAIASIYFTKMYFGIHKLFEPLKSPKYKLLVGGLAIGIMLYFIPPLYGEGFSFISDLLDGNHLSALGSTPFDDYLSNIWVEKCCMKQYHNQHEIYFHVIDENEALVGIVLLDDIREFMFETSLYRTTTVSTFMHAAPEYIFYGKDNMQQVMKKFQDSSAWNLPVIKDGKYYGFNIDSPKDLRQLKPGDLPQLAQELRKFIIDIVATKEGHLGASLGVVELTIALHYIFDTPNDKLIWDFSTDNAIGIDPSVGALKKYLTNVKKGTAKDENIFECLNFDYTGPIDGHDLNALLTELERLKSVTGPKLLHIITTKGKGLKQAEENQVTYHAPGKFDKETGDLVPKNSIDQPQKYQDVFGHTIVELAKVNKTYLGITPAMPTGSSLKYMMEEISDRAFDVGIAEQHAVTMAAGMATEGLVPFCNIYSTFLQRAYDQVIHDVAIQNLPVVFCLDRAGLVGQDGATHHGVYDIAYLRCIPNLIIFAPRNEIELRNIMYTAQLGLGRPIVIRYPRGRGVLLDWKKPFKKINIGTSEELKKGTKIAVLSIGHIGNLVSNILNELEHPEEIGHYDMRFVKPIDKNQLENIFANYSTIITIEDGCKMGGFGTAILEYANDMNYSGKTIILGINDTFIEHGTTEELYQQTELDFESVKKRIKAELYVD
ncbi:1-deoxy-D-xylulose-5-phosphate synthase [Nymphon striatum]|nr:1-deoxy-D-xylulose-5-phosphate synthase [Nymphon striatum]